MSELAAGSSPDDRLASPGAVPWVVHLGGLLAWAGMLICWLLAARESFGPSFLCPAGGGCDTVLASRYAVLLGVPLPWFGMAFYGVAFALWLAVSATASRRPRLRLADGILWLALAGTTFSAGLMMLQFGVLRAFCPLCTASAAIMLALLGTALRARRVLAEKDAGASLPGAVTLALFALLSSAILLVAARGGDRGAGRIHLLDLAAAPSSGPRTARVQLVVFSDFQCHFCRELAPVLHRLRADFPQDLLVVFRHWPLAAHPRALAAAVAAECAGEQGRFWEYHDRLFAERGELDDAKLLTLAGEAGLDQALLAACLRSGGMRARVEASRREAGRLGLEGVPAVFLNGRRVRGPLDHAALTRRIQEALAP
jgi:protein-disulfide isomerase